jgi:ATP dependent DNA ligase domain
VTSGYLTRMLVRRTRTDGFIEPCIPSLAHKPPSGPDWVHEVKHDGYRLIVRRDGETVRLFTRRGYDWTERYPAIVAAAANLNVANPAKGRPHCFDMFGIDVVLRKWHGRTH